MYTILKKEGPLDVRLAGRVARERSTESMRTIEGLQGVPYSFTKSAVETETGRGRATARLTGLHPPRAASGESDGADVGAGGHIFFDADAGLWLQAGVFDSAGEIFVDAANERAELLTFHGCLHVHIGRQAAGPLRPLHPSMKTVA